LSPMLGEADLPRPIPARPEASAHDRVLHDVFPVPRNPQPSVVLSERRAWHVSSETGFANFLREKETGFDGQTGKQHAGRPSTHTTRQPEATKAARGRPRKADSEPAPPTAHLLPTPTRHRSLADPVWREPEDGRLIAGSRRLNSPRDPPVAAISLEGRVGTQERDAAHDSHAGEGRWERRERPAAASEKALRKRA